MLKLMSFINIHNQNPIFFHLIINPKISKDFTICALTSEHNQIMINTNHSMTVSRSRSISLLWSLTLPIRNSMSIRELHYIIHKDISPSNVFQTSENPNRIIKLFTSCMMLSCFESHITFWTNNSKLLHFVYSCN